MPEKALFLLTKFFLNFKISNMGVVMNKDEVKILQEVKELYCLPVTFKISGAIGKNIDEAIKHLYPKDSEEDQKKEKIKELVKSADAEFKKKGILLNLDQYESQSGLYTEHQKNMINC